MEKANKKKEFFCITCGYNFDASESIYEAHEIPQGDLPTPGISLCPKCCHEEWTPEIYPRFEIKKNNNVVKSFNS